MKLTTDQSGKTVYAFTEDEKEIADKIYAAMLGSSAERYVIDRMIDGVSQCLIQDLCSGVLKAVDCQGEDVDSPGNVVKVAVKFLADIVSEAQQKKEAAWELAYQAGLPCDNDVWQFDPSKRQFSSQNQSNE